MILNNYSKMSFNNIKTKHFHKLTKVITHNHNKNLYKGIQTKTFLKKLNVFSSEIQVYDKKLEEKNFVDVEIFTKDFLNYSVKDDFKVDKDKIILPKNYDIELPFLLYESNCRPGIFIFVLICLSSSLSFIYKYIDYKLTAQKFNPTFAKKYVIIQTICIIGFLFFLSQQFRIIRRISINNFIENGAQKNLEITLFTGKTYRENFSSLWFDKSVLMKLPENKVILCKIKEKRHYLTFKGSKVHDRALFMSIIRGLEFKSNNTLKIKNLFRDFNYSYNIVKLIFQT